MRPIITVYDVVEEHKDLSIRERVISVFGVIIHRKVECYPNQAERTIGFTSGTSLTYVEDD